MLRASTAARDKPGGHLYKRDRGFELGTTMN